MLKGAVRGIYTKYVQEQSGLPEGSEDGRAAQNVGAAAVEWLLSRCGTEAGRDSAPAP